MTQHRAGRGSPYLEYGELAEARRRVEDADLRLYAVENQPFHWYKHILSGEPGREEQIENWRTTLRSMGKAGIPVLGYNLMSGSAGRFSTRTDLSSPARGGARVSSFKREMLENPREEARATWPDTANIAAMTEDQMWDNVAYFLKAVIPVAEEAGVKMALHPDDPPVPSIHGLPRIASSHAGLRRILEIAESDSNGLDFCQGTVSEMDEDVYEAIRYFGSRNKIFYVHFRSVSGPVPSFSETFIDEGHVDMHKAMRLYSESGVTGPFIEDHVPHVAGDDSHQHRSRAFAIGYIKALLDTVASG